jgi:hypothetical protein
MKMKTSIRSGPKMARFQLVGAADDRMLSVYNWVLRRNRYGS